MTLTKSNSRMHLTELNTWSVLKELTSEGLNEAFYLCDLRDIINKHKIWIREMPRVIPHYAVKCNPDPTVIKTLAALGTGFDCASKGEIQQVLSLGVHSDRIIFAHPTKIISHITYAANVNVSTMTFDSEIELHKIKKYYPSAKTVIRIKCDDPEAHYKLGKKFGCDPDKEASKLLKLALDLGINVIGVSFHVGSTSKNPIIYGQGIERASRVFKASTELGFKFNLLDIGGGYLGEHGTSIIETAQIVNKALDEFFPDKSVRVISEPGRYYVSSAFTLCTNIHTVKIETDDADESKKYFHYFIDQGIFTSFAYLLFGETTTAQSLKNDGLDKSYPSTVWGPTCDSSDCLCEGAMLPKMDMGDWIVFEDLGAYTSSLATKFNGFPLAKIHYVASKSDWDLLKDIISENRLSVRILEHKL